MPATELGVEPSGKLSSCCAATDAGRTSRVQERLRSSGGSGCGAPTAARSRESLYVPASLDGMSRLSRRSRGAVAGAETRNAPSALVSTRLPSALASATPMPPSPLESQRVVALVIGEADVLEAKRQDRLVSGKEEVRDAEAAHHQISNRDRVACTGDAACRPGDDVQLQRSGFQLLVVEGEAGAAVLQPDGSLRSRDDLPRCVVGQRLPAGPVAARLQQQAAVIVHHAQAHLAAAEDRLFQGIEFLLVPGEAEQALVHDEGHGIGRAGVRAAACTRGRVHADVEDERLAGPDVVVLDGSLAPDRDIEIASLVRDFEIGRADGARRAHLPVGARNPP